MSKGPQKTKCFVKFLEHLKCREVTKKNGGSHYHYKCPNCLRRVTVRKKDKEIPIRHISSNCLTLKISVQECLDWISENC